MVDSGKDEGKEKGAQDIDKVVFVSKNAAGTGDGSEDDHDDFESNANFFILNVFRENHSNHEENGGDDHGVGRREGNLAGAIWAIIDMDNLIKDKVNDGHQDQWEWHPEDLAIDFFKGAALDPLHDS